MKEVTRASFMRIALAGAVTVAALGMFGTAGPAQSAPNSDGNPYPYAKSSYWAWQNRPDLPPNLGMPKEWDTNAAAQGWPVSKYPRRGDIAVFEPGIYGAHEVEGHVAVVEQVFDDGTYATSAMDEHDCHYTPATCGEIHQRTYPIVHGTSFIHYKKDTRTTWGFASGAAGWTEWDLGKGNMGGPGWYYPIAGADPQLVSPELDLSLASYNAVEVDMVIGAPVADPTLQMYFATEGNPSFSEANSGMEEGKADGELHRYTFYFGKHAGWQGKLTRLRFDPSGPGTTGGVRVDRIRLVRVEAPQTTYRTLSDHNGGRRSR
ncbi:MAG: CHAP domain-containing protein [Chloroflexota bacterium]|nr:CHAP domain-containing protein [Chloroflexota bacterium]